MSSACLIPRDDLRHQVPYEIANTSGLYILFRRLSSGVAQHSQTWECLNGNSKEETPESDASILAFSAVSVSGLPSKRSGGYFASRIIAL